MQQTQTMHWDTSKIKQYESESGQALLSDESTLVFFSQDFGKLIQSQPIAVSQPKNTDELTSLIQFANQHQLPITIRGNGLSQCGQSLPVPGGLTLSMQAFDKALTLEGDKVWVEANSSWANLLQMTLAEAKAPFVLPYNCNLSVAGVLSAGGVGASSFKYGAINAHVAALEVIDGSGHKQLVDRNSSLYHACLSGQGRFAVITKAQIELRPVASQVKTFCLVYSDQQQWFDDIAKLQSKANYMELFCSPSIQGAKLVGSKRMPMAQWLYGLHVSFEFNEQAPELIEVAGQLNYWNLLHSQEETISSYLLRHNARFEMMKMLGQWDLFHPWYECFVPTQVLRKHLDSILQILPIHYASLVHIAPVAPQKAGFLMLPDNDSISSFMILTPGVPLPLKDSCLAAITDLDAVLLQHGGKRYLSGFLGKDLPVDYWANHFGKQHSAWLDLKQQYDPAGIFTSMLHQS